MCDSCTSIQVEITPSAAQNRSQTTDNPLVPTRSSRQLAKNKTSRTKSDPVSVLPVHLQRYIFEFIDKKFKDLFNFARIFTRGQNIVLEFFDIEYIKKTISSERLRDFNYFNRRHLIESQQQSVSSSSSSSAAMQKTSFSSSKNPFATLKTRPITTTMLLYRANEELIRKQSFLRVFYEFLTQYKFDNFPEEFLFRADTRDPGIVFKTGFQRRMETYFRPTVQYGGSMFTGVKTAVPDTQKGDLVGTMVSTTTDLTYTNTYHHHWIYVCSPRTGLDLSDLDYQREVSLIYVAPEEIMLAYNKNTQQIFWNPQYLYFSQNTTFVENTHTGRKIITGNDVLKRLKEKYAQFII